MAKKFVGSHVDLRYTPCQVSSTRLKFNLRVICVFFIDHHHDFFPYLLVPRDMWLIFSLFFPRFGSAEPDLALLGVVNHK